MEREFLINRVSSVTLNVTGNRINSYRKKDEQQNSVRIYEDGKIGVAGSLGAPDQEALDAAAREALASGISYPGNLTGNGCVREDHSRTILAPEEFLPKMQHLLDRMAEKCPRFSVSNKIDLTHSEAHYENSAGSCLDNISDSLTLSLIFQNRGAGNLFDCAYQASLDHFDEDAVLADCCRLYDAFYTPAEIEAGEYPVFWLPEELVGSFARHFVGEMYASGASLLSGKLGQQVFSPALTICDDRCADTNPGACFFDDEGQFTADRRPPLVQDGVLANVLTSRGTAEMLHLPVSRTSASSYDSVPAYGLSGIYVKPTAESAVQIAPDRAVLIVVASGGDMTPDGHFATPVQLAYLVEKGEIVGRLPELNVSGDFPALLEKDYLGAVRGAFLPAANGTYIACRMKVSL